MKPVRCAIYTRKSSEEGLEQGFNSLDAQREACAAYVLSQASEGWTALPDVYDDGGISGGTLARPALQRLLVDVAAGKVDIIVVYKVDRLTRSLLDFSKLVEAFDKAGVSFVSITQSFNTTTSMGRLTLNMLLSFAQFEREVTAERIRDKIAASKAKGMWMGGIPPLGYRPDGRSLAVVEEHAAIIRHIFERYLALGNVRLVSADLIEHGITAPARRTGTGVNLGERPFSRGQLYLLLKNPIYIGRIAHRGSSYPGLHAPIVDLDVFERTQDLLEEHRQGRRHSSVVSHPSPLAGLIYDEEGEPLVATHTTKGSVRYRYYVSRGLQHGETKTGWRIPAQELEAAVARTLADALRDPLQLATRLGGSLAPAMLAIVWQRCADLTARLEHPARRSFEPLLSSVTIAANGLSVLLNDNTLAELLGTEIAADHPGLTLSVAARLTRSGRVLRLVRADGRAASTTAPNGSLISLLAQARAWNSQIRQNGADITTLAAESGKSKSYVSRVVRLAYLAPDVLAAMLSGTQRAAVGTDVLTLPDGVPFSWVEQRRKFMAARERTDG